MEILRKEIEMATRKKHRVTKGTRRLSIYKWRHPKTGAVCWRFAWQDGGKWRYVTRKKLDDAEAAAERILEEMEAGGVVWAGLKAGRRRFLEEVHRLTRGDEEEEVLRFLRARHKSGDVVDAVARFMEAKRAAAGEKTRHLENVRRDLEAMAKDFEGRTLADIHAPDLLAWWEKRNEGKARKTAKECRGNLAAFWRWARIDGAAPSGVSPAEKLPLYKLAKGERRVLTVDELRRCMAEVREDFRAWLVLGAFAGLRPEEVAPPKKKGMSKAAKRGLFAEEIDWEFGVIRVSAETSKVELPRIVPMTEALRAGLEWAGIRPGMVGPVQARNASEAEETKRLGEVVFGGEWPQDALRHSFGSYRVALVQSLERVAIEMGTSVKMLQTHYHNPQAKEVGEEWFEVRPVFRKVPIKSGRGKGLLKTSDG